MSPLTRRSWLLFKWSGMFALDSNSTRLKPILESSCVPKSRVFIQKILALKLWFIGVRERLGNSLLSLVMVRFNPTQFERLQRIYKNAPQKICPWTYNLYKFESSLYIQIPNQYCYKQKYFFDVLSLKESVLGVIDPKNVLTELSL